MNKSKESKGTEGLNFKQFIVHLPRSSALHLAEFDSITLFYLLAETVVSYRLAIMCCLANPM